MNDDRDVDDILTLFSNAEHKLFMSIDQAQALCGELAKRLYDRHPDVDCIVGVANGGLMPSYIVAETLNLPLKVIDIRRRGSSIKHKLFRYPWLATFFSILYRFKPFHWAMGRFAKRFAVPVVRHIPEMSRHRNFAIVDDAVETGNTLVSAKKMFNRQGREKPVAAVISWSEAYQGTGHPPDIHLCSRVHHYPWSGNNSEYNQYLSWLQRKGINLIQ